MIFCFKMGFLKLRGCVSLLFLFSLNWRSNRCLSASRRTVLYLSVVFLPVFVSSGQAQIPADLSICAKVDRDEAKGKLGSPERTVCPKGKGLGVGIDVDGGSGNESAEKSTNQNVIDKRENIRFGRSSPMDQSLGGWNRSNDERNEKIAKSFSQPRSTKSTSEQISDFNTKVLPQLEPFITEKLFKQFEEEFISKEVFNAQVRKQMEDWAKNTYPQIKKWVLERDNNISKLDILLLNLTMRSRLAKRIFSFGAEVLTKEKAQELGKIFLHYKPSSNWIQDWTQKTEQIIKTAKQHIEDPLYRTVTINQEDFYQTDSDIANAVKDMESVLYNKAYQLAGVHIFGPVSKELEQNSGTLNQAINDSVKLSKYTHFPSVLSASTPSALYKGVVTDVVNRHMQARYDRKDLEVLKSKGLGEPEEEPYEFKSPSGKFLRKNQELYEKLKEANPHHVQGIRAREIGLSAVEVADEAYAEGQRPSAKLAYSIGEGMADIALGVLPYVGVAKDVYEAITGRHLLTGRSLTSMERSFAFAGVALSAVTGGMFHSGLTRLAINRTDKVLSKINQRLWDRYSKGLSDLELARLLKRYPKALFKAIGDLGFKTKREVRSALHFVKRAFSGNNSLGMGEVAETLRFVNRLGIEDYSRALDELSKGGVKLPKAGEEFLARQLRFQQKLGFEGIDQASLVETGKVYSHFFKDIDKVKPEVVKETVWRAVRKTGSNREGQVFANNPEDLFKSLPGARYTNRRYSLPGEEAVYTSLSRKTVIQEVKAGTKSLKLTNQQVEDLFHIGSKDIELDRVLDLTNTKVQKLFKIGKKTLTEKDIATVLDKNNPDAYDIPHIIGHIAKRKGYKAIQAPSAPARKQDGHNLVVFEELR